jgi:thymidylate kinase
MFSVALVGGDGAGKTTIAKCLEESFPLPVKQIYMGISPISSNYALPTTRFVRYLKIRRYKKQNGESGEITPESLSLHLHYRSVERGPVWVMARTVNRLLGTIYRNIISLNYMTRGYVVIYDRHLLFELSPDVINGKKQPQPLDQKFLHWLLSNIFPKPDIVFFLDADPEILYSRKGEATLEHLAMRREAILSQGKKVPNFIQVDASQPLDNVTAFVTQHILEFHDKTN